MRLGDLDTSSIILQAESTPKKARSFLNEQEKSIREDNMNSILAILTEEIIYNTNDQEKEALNILRESVDNISKHIVGIIRRRDDNIPYTCQTFFTNTEISLDSTNHNNSEVTSEDPVVSIEYMLLNAILEAKNLSKKDPATPMRVMGPRKDKNKGKVTESEYKDIPETCKEIYEPTRLTIELLLPQTPPQNVRPQTSISGEGLSITRGKFEQRGAASH